MHLGEPVAVGLVLEDTHGVARHFRRLAGLVDDVERPASDLIGILAVLLKAVLASIDYKLIPGPPTWLILHAPHGLQRQRHANAAAATTAIPAQAPAAYGQPASANSSAKTNRTAPIMFSSIHAFPYAPESRHYGDDQCNGYTCCGGMRPASEQKQQRGQ